MSDQPRWTVRVDLSGLSLPDDILQKIRSINVSLQGPDGANYESAGGTAAGHTDGAIVLLHFTEPSDD